MIQRNEPDYLTWFRATGYEQWIKRAQRVAKAVNETGASKNELRELQRFILEFGHFNANFTLEELDGLLYPKSPTANMAVHSYLRSHQTIAAEIMRSYFYTANHIDTPTNLYPLFIDSNDLWKDVTYFCQVINLDDHAVLTSSNTSQSDIWVLLPADIAKAKINHIHALNTIREIRETWLFDHRVPERLQPCFRTKKGRVFDDEVSILLDEFLRDELAQIDEGEKNNRPHELPYQNKSTKEKKKWLAVKYGSLKKYNKAFLNQHEINSPDDLLAFVEINDNINLLIRTVEDAEAANQDREKIRKAADVKRFAHYNRAIDLWVNHNLTLFNQNIYFIVPGLKFMNIDTMVIVGHAESFTSDFAGPKQIVNRLGYRAESGKLIYALLDLCPGLFINKAETALFWQALMSVELFDKLPDGEKQIIATIPGKLEDEYKEKNTREHFTKLTLLLKNAKCSADRDIYKVTMLEITWRLSDRCKSDKSVIARVILHELVDHLFLFTHCITREDDFSFAQAIRALQSAGELLKLDLATCAQASVPVSLAITVKKKLLKKYPVQQVVVAAYGMRSYLLVIGACLADNAGGKLKLAVTNQNYFESLFNLKNMRASHVELKLVNNLFTDGFDADVVITELDPNSSTDKQLFQQDLKCLIAKLESHAAHAKMRLTLVIDITLNSINHNEIVDMLAAAKSLIDCGALSIILLQSLTKFSQIGLDQCNGGMSIVINNGKDWEKHNKFYANINSHVTTDVVTMRYFDFFAGLTVTVDGVPHALAARYIEAIVKSTNALYTTLLNFAPNIGSSQDNLIKMVQTTEYHLCYLAFNTAGILAVLDPQFKAEAHNIEVFNTHLKDHLILPICRRLQLPLTSRQSIGFPLSSVTVALTALRFTVGNESLLTLSRYASIIAYIFDFINKHSDLASLFKKDQDGRFSARIQSFQNAAQYFCDNPERSYLLRAPSLDATVYGPYVQKGETFYIVRAGNRVAVHYQNDVYQPNRLAVYQYGSVTNIMKMTDDQLDFIFGAADYKECRVDADVARYFRNKINGKQLNLTKQCMPVLKDSLQFDVIQFGSPDNRVCQIRYDELVAKQQHVNVYQRTFGKGLYVIDINNWGEKDPIKSCFLNLCIVLYVKQRFHCSFKVRGIPGKNATMYQRFLFSSWYDFDTLGAAFQEALNMVTIHKEALLKLQQDSMSRPIIHNVPPYLFSTPTHHSLHGKYTSFFNGPSSYPDASFVEKLFLILMISDRYEMILENKERKGIFAEKVKSTSANHALCNVTFFSSNKASVESENGEAQDYVRIYGSTL